MKRRKEPLDEAPQSVPIDDCRPGKVSPGVKADRSARYAKLLAMLFLEESLAEPSGTRRTRIAELVTLLLSRAIKSGEDDISVHELCDELEALRAAYEPAARFGA